MSIKTQLSKITDNWLLILILVLGLMALFFFSAIGGMRTTSSAMSLNSMSDYAGSSYYYRGDSQSPLMPNVLERIIVKTASLSVIVTDYTNKIANARTYITLVTQL